MTKTKMPEPAIFNASGVDGVIYSHGYTDSQMEAYKYACVREALEEAAKVPERYVGCDQLAEQIRALIPHNDKEQGK